MSSNGSAAKQGAIGGVLAATAIVVFFLVLDLASGQALDTPEFLASVMLGMDEAEVGIGVIALYTLLHYGAFAVLGAATAWALVRLRAPATALLGLVFGFLLFDIAFYASIALTGVDVVQAIGWPSFLAGNLIAGVVLMVYLDRRGVARGRTWGEALAEHRVIREGVIAGVLGGLAVAGWFFFVDVFQGRLLYTPGALGSALFRGVATPGAVEVSMATVLGYTAVHFGGYILMGLVFAALVTQAEERPPLLMGLVLLFITFETLLLGMVAILAAWLLDVLAWWSIALSNLVAAGIMAVYLWRSHPRLSGEVVRPDVASLERT